MPERMQSTRNAELTGNHYLSFPEINRTDAGIAMVSALHAGLGGIVAWHGDPLMKLRFGVGGAPVPIPDPQWQRLDRWIPSAHFAIDAGVTATLTIFAPGGYEPIARGGVIHCEIENSSASSADIAIALDLRLQGADLHIASPRPLPGAHRLAAGTLHPGIAFESGVPPGTAAIGFVCDDAGASYDTPPSSGPLDAVVSLRVRVRAGKTVRRSFFLGVGRDADSALAHAAHLRRVGAPELLRQARLELAQLARRTGDVALSEVLNRNLLFNHYFGLARAFDDDRLYAVSSRSPLHRPGALVNERELLFWTLPSITMTDPLLARELLRDAFEVYSAQPGLRLRYLDGGVFEPGFCLEQVLLYPLAVDRYIRETDDQSLLDDPLIQDVLREIDGGLDGRLDEDVLLCSTDLLPGGESADQPYPTLGNMLLWAYADALPRIWRADDGEAPASFDGAADDIASAVWQRCMAEVNGAQVFVSSTDLKRRSAVYDDPAMSLSLAPHFRFCSADDTTYRDTVALLRSPAYPFWKEGVAPGLASRAHPERASLAALCADLLGPRRNAALAVLRKLRLDDGLASDFYDPATGESDGGTHAASLAGFLAWTLLHALEGPVKRTERKSAR
jgi:hypothetical protein